MAGSESGRRKPFPFPYSQEDGLGGVPTHILNSAREAWEARSLTAPSSGGGGQRGAKGGLLRQLHLLFVMLLVSIIGQPWSRVGEGRGLPQRAGVPAPPSPHPLVRPAPSVTLRTASGDLLAGSVT